MQREARSGFTPSTERACTFVLARFRAQCVRPEIDHGAPPTVKLLSQHLGQHQLQIFFIPEIKGRIQLPANIQITAPAAINGANGIAVVLILRRRLTAIIVP